jgi:hypothetical protein
MKFVSPLSVSTLAILLAASPSFAQNRWSIELRGGGTVATKPFASDISNPAWDSRGVGLRITPDH